MLREVTLKAALQSYIEGEDVKVIVPMEEMEDRLMPMERLFNDVRFLMDEKAEKSNPGHEVAAQEMVSTNLPPQKKKKVLDMGKVTALRNAGWTLKKIADEMGVSEATIYNNLKKQEEAKNGDNESGCDTNVPEL